MEATNEILTTLNTLTGQIHMQLTSFFFLFFSVCVCRKLTRLLQPVWRNHRSYGYEGSHHAQNKVRAFCNLFRILCHIPYYMYEYVFIHSQYTHNQYHYQNTSFLRINSASLCTEEDDGRTVIICGASSLALRPDSLTQTNRKHFYCDLCGGRQPPSTTAAW